MTITLVRYLGKYVLQIVYGLEDEGTLDYFIKLNQSILEILLEIAMPGAYWVDFLPWLGYVPSWVPGATFQK